jgi:RNA polymerase sigma factor (TIGR02999 family)
MVSSNEITGLLRAWRSGREDALERLVPLVYRELRRRARRYMDGERRDHTLQPTALVNEVYLRLVDCKNVDWTDRAHFFAICSRLMRRILTDAARSQRSAKAGGKIEHVSLKSSLILTQSQPDLAALDEALKTLQALDPRKADVVELRFFGGLTANEAADVLHVSVETVMRDWRLAKVWLMRELSQGEPRGQ